MERKKSPLQKKGLSCGNGDWLGRHKIFQAITISGHAFTGIVLKKSGVRLPEHTFYVDNIFAYYPLPYVESLFYIDTDLYQYYLGREDQSVNEKVMISRIEQQIKVTKIVAECVDLKKVKEKSPKLADYMLGLKGTAVFLFQVYLQVLLCSFLYILQLL